MFSRDGSRLAAVGHSKEPTIFIWDVESEVRDIEPFSNDVVYFMIYHIPAPKMYFFDRRS